MTPGKIQDPEGTKKVMIFFKTAVRVILNVQRQPFEVVCFGDIGSGRLRVQSIATTAGNHGPALQGRIVILINKPRMY